MTALKLLCIFAHPDDESMGMGATLAKYSAEGVDTHLVCATRGQRGWFGPEEQNPGLSALGQLREKELRRAAETLGMKSVHFLDYVDGDLDRADPAEVIARIVTHIRAIQPQVIVTFPPDGNYGHPDHIAIGQFTQAAILCAVDASFADAQNLPPHRVSKLYYMVDGETFINFIAPFMGDMTFPVDDQIRGEFAWKEWMVTTRIDMSAYCVTAFRAIKCHESQMTTIGALADMPEEMAAQVLALQGAFYRAFSLVNGGRKVETDLFEGLRQADGDTRFESYLRSIIRQTKGVRMIQQFKIIVEKHPDGYVAYPLGINGVVVGEGDTYEEALADVKSAIQFHIETFGKDVTLGGETPVLEAFVAEAGVAV